MTFVGTPGICGSASRNFISTSVDIPYEKSSCSNAE